MPQLKKQPRPIKYKVEQNLIDAIESDHRLVHHYQSGAEQVRTKRDAGILKLHARGWTPGDIERATGVPAQRVRDLTRGAK